jgi:hypothetical protein
VENNRVIDFDKDFTEEEEAVFNPNFKKESQSEPGKAPVGETDAEEVKEPKNLTMDETIAKKYKLGMSVRQIIADHGISSGKVYEILARKKVGLRNGRYSSKSTERISTMTNLEKQSLILDYKNGATLGYIYRKYDINKNGTYQLLDEANIPRRMDRDVGNEPAPKMVENIKEATKPVIDTSGITLTKEFTQNAPINIRKEGDTLFIEVAKAVKSPVEYINISFKFKED